MTSDLTSAFLGASTLTVSLPQLQQQSRTRTSPNTRNQKWRRIVWTFLLVCAALAGAVAHYNVDKTLTDEDRHYIQLLLPGLSEGEAIGLPYEKQVALVKDIQERLLRHAPLMSGMGIPENQPREPKQFYQLRQGLCYDRSRVLEKIFTYIGLPSRHVSLFGREKGVHPLITLLFHHAPSHAVSEVLTSRGWMLVDSNNAWTGLDDKFNPVSIRQATSSYDNMHPIKWADSLVANDKTFYGASCIYVYGLYSRHGRFYPPYTSYIPDYRVHSLLYNFEWLRN